MYVTYMEYFSFIIKLIAELSQLARTFFTDGMRFVALCARSSIALAAENLFLRKQLAFYKERKVTLRRFDNVSRFILVLLSRAFAWKDALVNVTPSTFIGWHRAGFRLFWRWKSRPGRPRIPAELRALIREMARDNPRGEGGPQCALPLWEWQETQALLWFLSRVALIQLCPRFDTRNHRSLDNLSQYYLRSTGKLRIQPRAGPDRLPRQLSTLPGLSP